MPQRLFDRLWASGGAVTDPGNPKFAQGWTSEIPPHQYQNYWQLRADEQLQYLQQNGIEGWLATVTYANKAVVRGGDGRLYESVQAANTNQDPTADDGTWWTLFGSSLPLPRRFIDGFAVRTVGGTIGSGLFDEFTIEPGECVMYARDGGDPLRFSMTNALENKDLNANWAAGNGGGLRHQRPITTRFHGLHLLGNPTTGAVDACVDLWTNPNAEAFIDAAVAAGYTHQRQISGFRATALALVDGCLPYYHDPNDPDNVIFDTPIAHTQETWTTAAIVIRAQAPHGTTLRFNHYMEIADSSQTQRYIWVSSVGRPDVVPGITQYNFVTKGENQTEGDQSENALMDVYLDPSVATFPEGDGQFRWRSSIAHQTSPSSDDLLRIMQLGFRMDR